MELTFECLVAFLHELVALDRVTITSLHQIIIKLLNSRIW